MSAEKKNLKLVAIHRLLGESFVAIQDRDRRAKLENIEEDGRYLVDRDLDAYKTDIPTFGKKSFIDNIIEKSEGGKEIDILDIGAGEGIAMGQLIRSFPLVKIAGVSAVDLREDAPEELRPFVGKIDYRVSDVHRLMRTFRDRRFDIIVSDWSFIHFEYPLSVLRQCYHLLKPDGIAFIRVPGINISSAYRQVLEKFWLEHGIQVELHGDLDKRFSVLKNVLPNFQTEDEYDISFQKSTAPRFPIPGLLLQ